jgi:hypothetical protein
VGSCEQCRGRLCVTKEGNLNSWAVWGSQVICFRWMTLHFLRNLRNFESHRSSMTECEEWRGTGHRQMRLFQSAVIWWHLSLKYSERLQTHGSPAEVRAGYDRSTSETCYAGCQRWVLWGRLGWVALAVGWVTSQQWQNVIVTNFNKKSSLP